MLYLVCLLLRLIWKYWHGNKADFGARNENRSQKEHVAGCILTSHSTVSLITMSVPRNDETSRMKPHASVNIFGLFCIGSSLFFFAQRTQNINK
jgi:hypothetical protein